VAVYDILDLALCA